MTQPADWTTPDDADPRLLEGELLDAPGMAHSVLYLALDLVRTISLVVIAVALVVIA